MKKKDWENELEGIIEFNSYDVATKEVKSFISDLISKEREYVIEEVKKEFYRGCTRDEVVPRLDELLAKLKK